MQVGSCLGPSMSSHVQVAHLSCTAEFIHRQMTDQDSQITSRPAMMCMQLYRCTAQQHDQHHQVPISIYTSVTSNFIDIDICICLHVFVHIYDNDITHISPYLHTMFPWICFRPLTSVQGVEYLAFMQTMLFSFVCSCSARTFLAVLVFHGQLAIRKLVRYVI